MIKAKVLKSFYCAKDTFLYLDEDRFKDLSEGLYVEKVKDVENKKLSKTDIERKQIKKSTLLP